MNRHSLHLAAARHQRQDRPSRLAAGDTGSPLLWRPSGPAGRRPGPGRRSWMHRRRLAAKSRWRDPPTPKFCPGAGGVGALGIQTAGLQARRASFRAGQRCRRVIITVERSAWRGPRTLVRFTGADCGKRRRQKGIVLAASQPYLTAPALSAQELLGARGVLSPGRRGSERVRAWGTAYRHIYAHDSRLTRWAALASGGGAGAPGTAHRRQNKHRDYADGDTKRRPKLSACRLVCRRITIGTGDDLASSGCAGATDPAC